MDIPSQDRRALLARSVHLAAMLASAGLLPRAARAQGGEAAAAWNSAAFEAKSIDEALRALGAATPVPSPDVALTAPEIAENGAVVPVAVSAPLAGVTRIALLVDRNPNVLSAVFDIGDRIEPNVSTRVKMAQTANIYAVAITADGKVYYASQQVKVTIGGCGG